MRNSEYSEVNMRLVLVALSGLVASAAAYLSNYDSGDFFAQPTLEEIITRKRNELLDKVKTIASLIGIYYNGRGNEQENNPPSFSVS